MINYIEKKRTKLIYRILSVFIAFTFIFSSVIPPTTIHAQVTPQTILNLPVPGTMISPTQGFTPALIKGITIHPDNPLMFDFIVHPGEEQLQGKAFRKESLKLIRYFMAALTVPEDEMWVNLSPYEENRIIPDAFGQTEMGRDLLAQDYMLKQLTASLMYPEEELGEEFWKRVYKKAQEKYGTTEIPMNTFNKVWIVPEKAVIYENGPNVFVVDSYLKVLLEGDYIALEANVGSDKHGLGDVEKKDLTQISEIFSEVIREVILPEIEREVNEGKLFANLRQISNSVILATWYKQNIQQGILNQIYVNQKKTEGITTQDKEVNQKIYEQYVKAFEKGVYNFIKEDYDEVTQKIIPRKYFSGGAEEDWRGKIEAGDQAQLGKDLEGSQKLSVRFGSAPVNDTAMASNSSSGELKVVAMFNGMGNYRAVQSIGRKLYNSGIPKVRKIYDDAIRNVGLEQDSGQFFGASLNDDYNLAKILHVVHGVAYFTYLEHLSNRRKIPLKFSALASESLGSAVAAIVSGSISLSDYIKFSGVFWRHQKTKSATNGKRISLTIQGNNFSQVEGEFQENFSSFETFKYASPNISVVFISKNEVSTFRKYLSRNYKDIFKVTNQKTYPYLIHTKMLRDARENAEAETADIVFIDPQIPIISNSGRGVLSTSDQVRDELLSLFDRPMDSKTTIETIEALNPELVIEIGPGKKLPALLNINSSNQNIESFVVSNDLDRIGEYFLNDVQVQDINVDLEEGVTFAEASLISIDEVLKETSELTWLETLRWAARHPTDVLYRFSKHPGVNKMDQTMRDRIAEIMQKDSNIRDQILERLGLEENKFKIPLGINEDREDGNWRIWGRSISTQLFLNNGETWSLVFKGVPNGSKSEKPMVIAPHRMDYSPRQDGRKGKLPPMLSWVLRNGETYHTSKGEALNAYGLRAAYSLYGENANTAVPVGIFKLDDIPVKKKSKIVSVPTEKYFRELYEKLDKENKLRFLRYLRIDLDDTLSVDDHVKIRQVLENREIVKVDEWVRKFLEHWRPVVYGYLVKGDVNARVEKWDLRQEPFSLSKVPTTEEEILSQHGISKENVEVSQKIEIAETFARNLSSAAYYHNLGGDFGSRQASLTPKDVTINGAILDLDANMLAGSGSFLYNNLIHHVKRRWNVQNGKETVRKFAEALNLEEVDVLKSVRVFESEYQKKRGEQVTNEPYKNIWKISTSDDRGPKGSSPLRQEKAMANAQLTSEIETPGGIDLNPNIMEIESRGKVEKFIFKIEGKEWNVNTDIKGLVPSIITVSPVNIPMILGYDNGNNVPIGVGQDFTPDPVIHKKRFNFSDTDQVSVLN